MNNCIFCKIIKGEIPAYKVYEDADTLAFLDINPVHEGHTLVIPKDHFENIYGLPPEVCARLSLVAQKIAIALKNSIDAQGINIIMNNEQDAGQVVFHAHLLFIQIKKNDGLTTWPQKPYEEGVAEVMEEKIKKALL
jgi:histidine triad (HIT) family protein